MRLVAAATVGACVLVSTGGAGGPVLRRRVVRVSVRATEPSATAPSSRQRLSRRGRIVLIVLGGAIALVTVGPLVVAAVGGATMLVRRAQPGVAARRRTRTIDRALPDAIELFILTIQAGLSPVQATRELTASAPVEVREGFRLAVHRLERGEPFAQAVRALPERLGPGMVAFADLVGAADRYGTPMGPVLVSLAAEVRAARRRLDEADARRLPIRLSFPLVVCTLPSFVLLAIAPAVIAALSSLSVSF